jgi:HEAT repeat protein
VIGTLEDVLFALERALPRASRISFTAPDALFSQIKRSQAQYTTITHPSAFEKPAVTLQMENKPLREVLDTLCDTYGYRLILTQHAIVIDKPLPDEVRDRLFTTFASASDATSLAAAADAFAGSSDTSCLRPLLLAMANPGLKADAAVKAVGPLLSGLSGTFYSPTLAASVNNWPSPVVALEGDREIKQAVLEAIRRKQEPRAELLKLAGQLRMTEVLDTCIELVNRGFYHRFAIQKILDYDSYVLDRPAAEALGWIGGERAVDTLIATITKPNYLYQPNDQAIAALGRLQDPKAVQPLLKFVGDTKAYGPMRGEMIEALGMIGDVSAVDTLAKVLKERGMENGWVTSPVPLALAGIGTPEALELIYTCASRGNADDASDPAIAVLGDIGDARAQETLMNNLRQYFRGSNSSWALARIRNPDLIPRLREMLQNERDVDAYRHIADTLRGMRLPAAEQALLETIPPADSPLIWYHIRAMGGSPETAKAVLDMVKPGCPQNQRKAAAGHLTRLGHAGIPTAYDLIRNDQDIEVRIQAIGGFHGFNIVGEDIPAKEELERWLIDPEPRIRESAVSLAWNDSDRPAEERLRVMRAALKDPAAIVRKVPLADTIYMGFKNHDPLAEIFISAMRKDTEADLRAMAAMRLGRLNFPSVDYLSGKMVIDVADALVLATSADADSQVRAASGHSFMKLFHWLTSDHASTQFRIGRHQMPNLRKQHKAIEELIDRERDERVKTALRKALTPTPGSQLLGDFEWDAAPAIPKPPQEPKPTGADDF